MPSSPLECDFVTLLLCCSEHMSLIIKSAIEKRLITSLNLYKPPFLINNLSSAGPSFREELSSRLFLIDIIEYSENKIIGYFENEVGPGVI